MKTRSILLLLSLFCHAAGYATECRADHELKVLKLLGHKPTLSMQQCEKAKASDRDSGVAAQLEASQCGHPDFADKEIATSTPAQLAEWMDSEDYPEVICEGIIRSHDRMLRAVGQGSWRSGCHSDYPNHHASTYWVNRDSFSAHYHSTVTDADLQETVDAGVWGVTSLAAARELWGGESILDVGLDLVTESCRRAGCVQIPVEQLSDANVNIRCLPIPGSTIGVAWYNDTTCGDQVELRIDSTWRPSLHSFCWLLLHEWGHTLRLDHIFSGQSRHHSIMSYQNVRPFQGFRTGDEANPAAPRDPAWGPLVRYFGGEAVPKKDVEVIPDPKTPGSFPWSVGDSFVFMHDGRRVTTAVVKIEGDDGPSLGKRISAAMGQIEDYPKKEQDRQALALIYEATSQAVGNGVITSEVAQDYLERLRVGLVSDLEKWSGVLAIADNAPASSAALNQVWEGLTGNAAIGPVLIRFLPFLISLLSGEDPDFDSLITIILSLLSGL